MIGALHLHVAGGEENVRACSWPAVWTSVVPLGSQNGSPGAHGWNLNSFELPADLPVIALLRFLDPLQVGLEVRVTQERRAVDALHRLVLRIPLPVRVRGAQQLERLEPPGRRHVRADAEIDERVPILDRVAGDLRLSRGLLLDQLYLERLAVLREELLRFLARPRLPLVRQVLGREFLHLLFDGVEILGHERPIDDEVVEEALVGGRPDPALRAGEEVGHRSGHEVRRAVPIQRKRLRAVGRDDADARIPGERKRRDRRADRRPPRRARPWRAAERSLPRRRQECSRRAGDGSSRRAT